MKLILTCEHGGKDLPEEYRQLFEEAQDVLHTHRAYDPGALDLFRELEEYADYSHYSTTTRLLVELNRSEHHRQLFSEYTRDLPRDVKDQILKDHYYPYRGRVEKAISTALQNGKNEQVLHVSIHSFTPELQGKVRNADVGLLFDPGRRAEKDFCRNLKTSLLAEDPDLKIRFNYPYRGTSDGFTTYLRKKLSEKYLGIEVEVNQKLSENNKMRAEVKSLFRSVLKAPANMLP